VLNHQVRVSKDTETRILQAVQALGYRPNLIARSLRSQRSRTIGYSWEPTLHDPVSPVLERFLESMAQAAESAGYYLLIFLHRRGAAWIDAYKELIDTNRVDGFVVSSVEYNDRASSSFLLGILDQAPVKTPASCSPRLVIRESSSRRVK
jgi:LacI family transcriptional regulator